MATTDKAVQNQKVFVQLKAVMELQKEYLNWKSQHEKAVAENRSSDVQALRIRRQAFERVIRLLDLPIEIPLGA